MAKILVPIPQYGFDPTESAIPWKTLKAQAHSVTFATPDGGVAEADRRMVTGEGLPFLLRRILKAAPEAATAYGEMSRSPEFQRPIRYEDARQSEFDALLLPGGHDKGMRPYLESGVLQKLIRDFFAGRKPVAAICHGTLLAGRAGVLRGRKTTGLTLNQEMIAYYLTRYKLGYYYRTYETPMATELISCLETPSDYTPGPGWPVPFRGGPGFTVRDGNYLSARWPGDAQKFADDLTSML